MFEHAATIAAEIKSARPVAVAVVTSVTGSAPRPVGTTMVLTTDGRVAGSVSGGCVESAVLARAEEVLHGATPTTEVFGFGDAEAFAVGLACGGTVEVLVTRVDRTTDDTVIAVWRAVARGDVPEAGIVVDLDGPSVGQWRLDPEAAPGTTWIASDEAARLVARPPEPADFLIYGGVDVADPLARLARAGGYRVTVVDARPAFAGAARFPAAHAVVRRQPVDDLRERPDRPDTVICVLTHEDRFDLPLLREALTRDAAFVGAIGSRATARGREVTLLEAGLSPAEVSRLHAPLGLDLGGRSAFETALSVMAEVVAAAHGRRGGPLRDGTGPLHEPTVPAPQPRDARQTRSRLNGAS